MNRLSNTGEKFKMKLKKVGGGEFYGQLLENPDTSRVSNFLTPRRYLRTGIKTSVKPCDVIIANRVKFIVAEHGDGFYKEPIYKHFKLFQVDLEFTYYKKSYTENSVTGIQELNRNVQPEVVYISMQPKSDIEDSINIAQQTYTAISNKEIKRDETLVSSGKSYTVIKTDAVLGVYLLELKET